MRGKSYRENLRCVLDGIEFLLENLDSERVIISADHGNAFGEQWMWGHPIGVSLPCVREVSWFTTHATDNDDYVPSEYERSGTDEDIESRLRALGYAE